MRQLFLWHRWLGIAACLFMALWFVSGMVMLFVGYPKLTPAEQLQHLPELSETADYIDVNQAIKAAAQSAAPLSITLSSIANKPYYLLTYPRQPVIAVNALSGQRVNKADKQQAIAAAQTFSPQSKPHYLGLIEKDAWTQSTGLDAERPLHKVQIDDAAGRILYISSHSGQIIRDATFQERSWGWLGAWLHWIYPLRGLPFWADLIIYLSLTATIMSLMGQIIGIKRWRFSRTYRHGSHSPYRNGFARWHHIGGLLFGFVLIAWIFSGLMSMRPWQVLPNQSAMDISAFQGGDLQQIDPALDSATLVNLFEQAGLTPRELVWHKISGQTWVTAYNGQQPSLVLPVSDPGSIAEHVPLASLKHAIETLPVTAAPEYEWLSEYDFYYYDRAPQSMYGARERPLPLLRVKFADPAQTWIHIDPNSGEILENLDKNRRVARWLFNLLHSWDIQPLLSRPVLRDILMVSFSLGGLMISITGIVMGWRRLRRKATKISRLKPKQVLARERSV